MGKLSSKATIQKTAITVTAFVCIVMGQNCGRKTYFSAVDGSALSSMKDGGGTAGGEQPDQVVTTLQPHEASGSSLDDRDSDESTETTVADAAADISSGGSGETATSASDEVCMDVEKIEPQDLGKVATQDDHGHLKNIVICHNVANNPKEHLVSDGHSLKAHLGHGDYIGACGAPVVKACQTKTTSAKDDKET
jgi:hypothetical protein